MPLAESVERRHHPRSGAARAGAVVLAAAALLVGAATAATAERYHVDTGASRVRVFVERAGLLGFLGHDHEFAAPISEGWIDVDVDDPASSQVDLHWKAAALAVVPGTEPEEDVPQVEEQLRGPEVLDVEAHPGIRFWSFDVRVEAADPEAGRWDLHVKGGLEIRGTRHRIEVPLSVRREGDALVTTGEVELNLDRLGVHPPSVAGVVKVSDEFRVAFEVHAGRRAPEPSSD